MTFLRGVSTFVGDDSGGETVEYAILTGLIVAASLAALAAIGSWVLASFQTIPTS